MPDVPVSISYASVTQDPINADASARTENSSAVVVVICSVKL